jgi:myo-inositol-1(or 4)-monophosphatase
MSNRLDLSLVDRCFDFSLNLAREVADFQLAKFRQSHNIEWTSRSHFRTEVDVEIGRLVREKVVTAFPEININSEEDEDRLVGSDYTLVVDELDGTLPFTRMISDHFSFCVALCYRKMPVFGIVIAPQRRQEFTAIIDRGAFCNGEPLHATKISDLGKVIMGLDPGKMLKDIDNSRRSIVPFASKLYGDDGISCFLCSGCASVPLCLVATGQYDAYLATQLEPEDMAAAVAIIGESIGGIVTNLKGEEWKLGDRSILASSDFLHDKLLEFLAPEIEEHLKTFPV